MTSRGLYAEELPTPTYFAYKSSWKQVSKKCPEHSQARIRDFLKGGGGGEAPPLDIVCVTSPALQKIVKHPHSWTFTSTPPLGHCTCDVIHIPKGGGVIGPVTHTWHRFLVSGQVQGGGVITPTTPPPWIRH